MRLSQFEEILVGYLKTYQMQERSRAMIFLMLENDTQMEEMCWFLEEHPDATEQEILTKAQEISGERTP